MSVAGLLLAAGAGRRMGGPKALLRDRHGVPFVDRSVGALLDGGCASVCVVVGAAADQVRAVLDEAGWLDDEVVTVVVAADWAAGMGASLHAGLSAAAAGTVLVSLVDLPDVGAPVVARLVEADVGPGTLARATYDGMPGHPVLLGSEHLPGVLELAHGDKGARDYLAGRRVLEVECGDLAGGRDVDTPDQLPPAR